MEIQSETRPRATCRIVFEREDARARHLDVLEETLQSMRGEQEDPEKEREPLLRKGPTDPFKDNKMAEGGNKTYTLQQKLTVVLYLAVNVASASGIVFANKAVFKFYNFPFAVTLTWVHTLFTILGMRLFAKGGLFTPKKLTFKQVAPLAAAFVGYVVLNNISLNLNSVGFYQISKILISPAILVLEKLLYNKSSTLQTKLAIVLVLVGVGIASVSDVSVNFTGTLVALAAVLVTATYQIWVGTKQKELGAGSMQLLHEYTPAAALFLMLLIPALEPVGLFSRAPGTIMGFEYTYGAIVAIMISALLGLVVSLSTFLVIGATSSITYNVVGHMKTVIIIVGGYLFFGDEMNPRKFLGIVLCLGGVYWYTHVKLASAMSSSSSQEPLSAVRVQTSSKQ